LITYLINTTNQILAKSKEVIHIKILTDAMDSSEWLEISKEEYENHYTDKINYMHCFEQDTGKVGYYKRELFIALGREWFESEIKNERIED